jgi:hypothetical protein
MIVLSLFFCTDEPKVEQILSQLQIQKGGMNYSESQLKDEKISVLHEVL